MPSRARGIVLFAHGSGSSRFSPRNHYVADVLQQAELATLLFDLLTEEEELLEDDTASRRFDIPLLADRLIGATTWVKQREDTRELPIGYFGARTGAAAALVAAARAPDLVAAIVARGGRPELAGERLRDVLAPTLLIVGSRDEPVLELNRAAERLLRCEKELVIVQGASHLFEEPGTLEEVSLLASEWFQARLPKLARITDLRSRPAGLT